MAKRARRKVEATRPRESSRASKRLRQVHGQVTKEPSSSPPVDVKEEVKIEIADESEPIILAPAAGLDLLNDSKIDIKMSKSKLKIIEGIGKSPFPDFAAPTPEVCEDVANALAQSHHHFPKRPVQLVERHDVAGCGEVPDVLDALVRTVLSQNTNDRNSTAAKKSLNMAFGRGNYDAVRQAPLEAVAKALECGGLANIKAKRIKSILDTVHAKYGRCSLDHMHDLSTEEAKEELLQFDGIGPKTASCVLLFCLSRESFAVDTHVFRITKSLGWVPKQANRETTFLHLDHKIPGPLKYP